MPQPSAPVEGSIRLADAQIEWTPASWPADSLSGRLAPGNVLAYSRAEHLAGRTGRTPIGEMWKVVGDCDWHTPTGAMRLAIMMTDFHTLVVRDGIDPKAAHREFLKIREFRELISPDCPGAD